MAASKLRLYQDALRLLADARLDTIVDETEARHALDDAWDESVAFVLRQASWRFAIVIVGIAGTDSGFTGYAWSFAYPDDWHRTHAIYLSGSDGRRHPIDILESPLGTIRANKSLITLAYVSNTYTDPEIWSEHFAQAVAAYLAFQVAERVTGDPATAGRMSQLFAQLLEEATAVDAEPNDRWLPYQRNGDMLRGAHDILSTGFWRFALVTAAAVAGGAAVPDFTNAFLIPDDWMRTHAIFQPSNGKENPIDVREAQGIWSTNVAEITVRYVSKTRGLDTTLWPEPFRAALLELLSGDQQQQQPPPATGAAHPPSPTALDMALAIESEPPNRWLKSQFDGGFEAAKNIVMREGNWVYRDALGVLRGLKERQYSYLDDQASTQPSYPFPFRYPLPVDWFKTHALYQPWDGEECPINIVETTQDWSTDAQSFVARYIGTDVLDSVTWPDEVTASVLAYLDWQAAPAGQAKEFETSYRQQLGFALARHSRPDDDWLRFQFDRSLEAGKRELLEKGRWRFAVKTVTSEPNTDPLPSEESDGALSQPYAYRYIPPNDLLRTITVYHVVGVPPYARRYEIAFRDEQGAIYADCTPVEIRYVSRMGLDSTKWSAHFRDALLAWLQYREARGDPAMTSVAQVKFAAYEKARSDAEKHDDARDRPRINSGSRVIAAMRYGRYGSQGPQDWRW